MEKYKIEALIRMYKNKAERYKELVSDAESLAEKEAHSAARRVYQFVISDLEELLNEGEEI